MDFRLSPIWFTFSSLRCHSEHPLWMWLLLLLLLLESLTHWTIHSIFNEIEERFLWSCTSAVTRRKRKSIVRFGMGISFDSPRPILIIISDHWIWVLLIAPFVRLFSKLYTTRIDLQYEHAIARNCLGRKLGTINGFTSTCVELFTTDSFAWSFS